MKSQLFPGRLFLIVTIICLSLQNLLSQSIQNEAIANASSTTITCEYMISWTLGESFIETFKSDNIQITQGFHQPLIELLDVSDPDNSFVYAKVYPNPTKGKLNIRFIGPTLFEKYHLTVTDIRGTTLENKEAYMGSNYELDCSQVSSETLFIDLTRKKDGTKYSFKILKVDY